MRATLPAEVAAFLQRGPATASEVAMAVRARRDDVDAALASGLFLRAPRPEGGSARAVYWSNVSEPVLGAVAVTGKLSRDRDFLLAVLGDGKWHPLTEILARSFADRGIGLTVHSRAADLRRDGHVIENRMDGVRGGHRKMSSYRLIRKAVERQAAA